MMHWKAMTKVLLPTILLVGMFAPQSLAARDGSAETIRGHVATLNQAIQEGNEPMRNKMFMEFRLIEQDHAGAVAPILMENLASPISGVPEYTAFILGWIADERAVPKLREMLKKSDSFKRAACQALGNMEATAGLEDMVALLTDASPRVRQDAAYSLGLLGDVRAKPHLEKAKQDADELVRFMAEEAVERIDNRQKYGW